jgi:NAD(P)-dependent dehydrogenase (short-subunit alcohol dehydrogenase family)
MAIDFSTHDESAYQALAALVASQDVRVLSMSALVLYTTPLIHYLHSVNNVGKSHDMPDDFHVLPADEMQQVIDINVYANTRVAQIVAPHMVVR